MPLSKPEKLLAIGLDLQTASRLASLNWTAAKLKKAKASELDALGVSAEARTALMRPPIPIDVLSRVLHKSKRTCCVCRNRTLPIIIHHIDEWHSSRDHNEGNLAVLCLIDHGEAHTKRMLSQNLSSKMIRVHKARWEEQVRIADAKAIIGLTRVDGANWDYVNLMRVFRLADELAIKPQTMPHFITLQGLGLITSSGDVHRKVYSPAVPGLCMYLCGLEEGRMLYRYTSGTLEALVKKLGLVDISNVASFSEIRALAEDGSLIFIQAPFYFRRDSKVRIGEGQWRTGYTNVGGVRINFVFDAWESTSSSAHTGRLSGRKVESVVGLVSGADSTTDPPTLQISCLGIGSFFQQIHFRPVPRSGASNWINEDSVDW